MPRLVRRVRDWRSFARKAPAAWVHAAAPLLVAAMSGAGAAHGQELLREICGAAGQVLQGAFVPGDLDGDGVRDIVTSVAPVAGGDSWLRAISGRTGTTIYDARHIAAAYWSLGDVDRDGRPDMIAYANPSPPVVPVVVSGRDGSLIRQVLDPSVIGTIGDLDRDGVDDYMGSASAPPYDFSVFSGRTGMRMLTMPTANGYPLVAAVAVGDVTGDGYPDVVVVEFARSLALLSPVDRRTVWMLPTTRTPLLVVTGDVNGDGHRDLAHTSGPAANPAELVILSVADARILRRWSLEHVLGVTPPTVSNVGDVSGDGIDDLAVSTYNHPDQRTRVFSVREDRTLYVLDRFVSLRLVGLGDTNGDGFNDFAVPSNPCIQVYGPVVSGYSDFGTGCAGSAGVPRLSAASAPTLGGRFELQLANLPTFTFAILAFGASNSTWGAIPLPADLTALGAPACRLHVSGDVFVSVFSTNGTSGWSATIPMDIALLRSRFYNQALSFDARANALGIAVSNAGEGFIGW